MAGYSARKLSEKLNIKPDMHVCFLNAKEDYVVGMNLPEDVIVSQDLVNVYDLIQVFIGSVEELHQIFPKLLHHIQSDGMIWISWPKKSASIRSDLNENIIRQIGLDNGLVDVKVIAVDNDWSGLKFVYRLKDRLS